VQPVPSAYDMIAVPDAIPLTTPVPGITVADRWVAARPDTAYGGIQFPLP
jgi:hypothetical protein